jgi:hypothetical protein
MQDFPRASRIARSVISLKTIAEAPRYTPWLSRQKATATPFAVDFDIVASTLIFGIAV